MLDSLKNFTITALHIKLNLSEQEFQQWLTDLGLLHKKRTCVCGREMRKENIINMEDGFAKRKHDEKQQEHWLEHFSANLI